MTRRIGGLMDYSKLAPAAETSAAVADRARRMHSAGHGLHDIASALRVHPEQVRRWLVAVEHGGCCSSLSNVESPTLTLVTTDRVNGR